MPTQSHVYRRCTLVTVAATLVLGITSPARAQLGLSLAPMRVELRMMSGQQYSGSLQLTSNSDAKTRIRAEVLDFDIDASTTPQFERDLPQESPYSCKKWLSLNPMEIEVEPSGVLPVRYTLQLPAGLPEGSYNCAAGFTTLPKAGQAGGTAMQVAVRVVAAFYVVVGSPQIRGRLKEISLESAPAGSNPNAQAGSQAVVVLENSGEMYFRPTGNFELLDGQGKVVETAAFKSLPVLRERSQRFLFPLKARLEAGNYKLRARVDIGTDEIQEGSVEVTVDPAEAKPETRRAQN